MELSGKAEIKKVYISMKMAIGLFPNMLVFHHMMKTINFMSQVGTRVLYYHFS